MPVVLKPRDQWFKIARQNYLKQNPHVLTKIHANMPPDEAFEFIGISKDEYIEGEIFKTLQKEAEVLSIDISELQIRYAADTKEEEAEMLEIWRKEIRDAIGL